jgi:predicted alpha/beta-fold hydrolase
MTEFQPPQFRSHPLIRGGHLQTIFSVRSGAAIDSPTTAHLVKLPDGDSIAVHENCPESWQVGDPAMLLVHGLAGCHAAPYMIRLAQRFYDLGTRVYRMDLRGCGAGAAVATQLSHAGRSDDLREVLGFIANQTQAGPMSAVAISLGANQLLRLVGRIGAGLDARPAWFDRLQRIAAVAPPLDLKRCSDNMQRLLLRPYNYYFIRLLLSRVPPGVRQREDYQAAAADSRPRTLRELDSQFTAPLSGFADADDYYHQASACRVTRCNPVDTLVLTAADDPMVPIGCFTDDPAVWSDSTQLLISPGGGHVGFIAPQRQCWMDHVLARWFKQHP